MSETSWETLQNFEEVQQEMPNMHFSSYKETPSIGTDVFFLGVYGTGKTCILMGLVGANGGQLKVDQHELIYTLNLQQFGGNYAAALREYVYAGIPTWSSPHYYSIPIAGCIHHEKQYKRSFFDKYILGKCKQPKEYYINCFELGCVPDYLIWNYENKTISFSQLNSKNRKILFIIIDPTSLEFKHIYLEDIKDENGIVIDLHIRHKYYKQDDILSKFISFLEHPDNQEIMERVDAIHFIVTKADLLDKDGSRDKMSVDLVLTKYAASINQLKELCRKYKHINRATRNSPLVFTFSLGKFYLGDIFEYDPTDSHKLIRFIYQIIKDQNKPRRGIHIFGKGEKII